MIVEIQENPFDPSSEWFYEGNVQAKIREYLSNNGWAIKGEADTRKRSRGPDLLAEKDGKVLHIEVKGYPSKQYVSGINKGKEKRTKPATQARHWIGEAILGLIVAKTKQPKIHLALGLPKSETYVKKICDIHSFLRKFNCKVFWVDAHGRITEQ